MYKTHEPQGSTSTFAFSIVLTRGLCLYLLCSKHKIKRSADASNAAGVTGQRGNGIVKGRSGGRGRFEKCLTIGDGRTEGGSNEIDEIEGIINNNFDFERVSVIGIFITPSSHHHALLSAWLIPL